MSDTSARQCNFSQRTSDTSVVAAISLATSGPSTIVAETTLGKLSILKNGNFKCLYVNGCDCKNPISTARVLSKFCQGGTNINQYSQSIG